MLDSPRNRPVLVFSLLLLLGALLFKQTTVIVFVAAAAALLTALIFRANRRVYFRLLMCALAWLLFEIAGRQVFAARIGREYNLDVDHRLRPDPGRGINSDGIRCDFEADDFHEDTCNIIFLGDSFTFGMHLPSVRDAFPAQVEEILNADGRVPRVRSVNFGWISSSPLLSGRLLCDIGAKYKPDIVILNLDLTDFHDDLRYRRFRRPPGISPTAFFLRRAGIDREFDFLRDSFRFHTRLWPEDIPLKRFFVVFQPLPASLPYMRDTENNIRDIAEFTRRTLGAEFMLVMLPRSFQYSRYESENWESETYPMSARYIEEPFRWLERFAAGADFPVHSLLDKFKNTDVFPTCLPGDPHWNREGSRVAAEGIVEFLRDDGLLDRCRRESLSP